MTDWNSIETAPRDGKPILGLFTRERMAVIAWKDPQFNGYGWVFLIPVVSGVGYDTSYNPQFEEDMPLAWQELPLSDYYKK